MSAPRLSRRAAVAALGFGTLMSLNGCTTFGGNVKGSFTCQAPDVVQPFNPISVPKPSAASAARRPWRGALTSALP